MSSQFSLGLAVISGLIGVATPIHPGSTSCAVASEKPAAARIDSLLAPIALLPDELVAKILIASTYPLEVNKAAEWLAQNSRLPGPAFDLALQKQHWDASVNDLARIPVVMVKMNDELVWTGKLGEAFLSNPQDVVERIQQLRLKAMNSGFLRSTAQQTVLTKDGKIIIEPAVAGSLYVPYYDAAYVYGAFPEQYWAGPPAGRAYRKGVAYLDRIALPAAFAGDRIDWRNGNLYVANKSGGTAVRTELWHHDPIHRRGVVYANQDLQQRFSPDVQVSNASGGRRARTPVPLSAPDGGLAGIGEGNAVRTFSERGRSSLRSQDQVQSKLIRRGSAT